MIHYPQYSKFQTTNMHELTVKFQTLYIIPVTASQEQPANCNASCFNITLMLRRLSVADVTASLKKLAYPLSC